MLALFTIAMMCFFALFGMMLILLRQAKSAGSARRVPNLDKRSHGQSRSASPSDTHAPYGVSQAGDGLTLSNLVPAKRPDWRFMVREGARKPSSKRKPPVASTRLEIGPLGRYQFDGTLGDLTDPKALSLAKRA